MNNPMQLKARIKNVAEAKKVSPQLVLQNYMLERLLERISLSRYKDNFIIKGGLLISSMIGIDFRTTMDLDTTIKNQPLNEESLKNLLSEICAISADDGISFTIDRIEPIRDDDEYGGYRAHLFANYNPMSVSVKVDVTTGDIITPQEVDFSYIPMFSDEPIPIKSYNLETLLAEKLETIISRSVLNTRQRDFYDIYILSKLFHEQIDFGLLSSAIAATASKRNSTDAMENSASILQTIESDEMMKARWNGYSREYSYTSNISFSEAVAAARELLIRVKNI